MFLWLPARRGIGYGAQLLHNEREGFNFEMGDICFKMGGPIDLCHAQALHGFRFDIMKNGYCRSAGSSQSSDKYQLRFEARDIFDTTQAT